MENIKRIVFFRNGSIGNTLVAIPAIRNAKAETGAYVAVIVDKIGFELLNGLPFIDELIVYERKAGLRATLKLVCELKKRKFDTAILLKRFFRNELIAFLAGIPVRAGYSTPGKRTFMLTHLVQYHEGKNLVDLNLDILNPLGIEARSDFIEVPVSPMHRTLARERLAAIGGRGFIACHFGGTTMDKDKWPACRYAELVRGLIEISGMDAVIFASEPEAAFAGEISKEIGESSRGKALVVAGLQLLVLAAAIEMAKIFVGNDSGPSHLADAVRTPSVILYGKSGSVEEQVEKWKPKGDDYIAVYSPKGAMSNISVSDALSSFERLLLKTGILKAGGRADL